MEDHPFLSLWPERRRGVIGQPFHHAVKDGMKTPEAVLEWVARWAAARSRNCWDEDARKEIEGLRCRLKSHRVEALAFAQCALHRAQQSPDERAREKAANAERGRQAWMSQQAPTEKQLAFLQQLGHDGPVSDKAEASRLIEELLAQRRLEGI